MRFEQIWSEEILKETEKQPKRKRLWLKDRSWFRFGCVSETAEGSFLWAGKPQLKILRHS